MVEKANAFVHALRAFDGKRALLLQDDRVVFAGINRFKCFTRIPMPPERCATGADQVVLKADPTRRRQLRDEARQIVARGEAIPDEQDLPRSRMLRFLAVRSSYHD